MAVDESEADRNKRTIDEGSGETKEENVVIPEQEVISINPEHELFDTRQDSSDSSSSSSIFSSEAEVQCAGSTSLSEEEHKGATNDPTTTVENCINPPQQVTTELKDSSDKSSSISHEPRVASFGENQGSVEETSNEPIKSASAKSNPVENVGQEKILGTKGDKIKQCAKSPKPTLNRINSAGSDTSSYSFAFPILVPGLPQRKAQGINPQGRVSLSLDEPDLEGENSISRPSPQKKSFSCCFCCFPCQSIFSNCFKCSSSY